MNNYQLYRTNIALGGQIKWDLTVENDSNNLVVNNFRLTPVVDSMPFNRRYTDNPLDTSISNRCAHLENLKTYYKKLEGSFYKPYTNPLLEMGSPIIVENNYEDYRSQYIDTHNGDLEMGIKRSKYSNTGKQFEYFCPIWLEDFRKGDILQFEFIIRAISPRNPEEYQKMISKTLVLDYNTIASSTVHNKFIQYFNNYMTYIGEGNISPNIINRKNLSKALLQRSNRIWSLNDELLKVNLNDGNAVIHGVNVKTGQLTKQNLTGLVDSILSSEKLMMDFDKLLIDSFEKNHIIAKQLFNFNFIFDAEDFLVPNTLELMTGSSLRMDVRVKINREGQLTELELKDFYSNYEYIPCEPVGLAFADEKNRKDINVFDLVADYRNPGMVSRNKVNQDIIHWSICGDNEYIFNMYSGFGGYIRTLDSENPKLTVRMKMRNPDLPVSDDDNLYTDSTMSAEGFYVNHKDIEGCLLVGTFANWDENGIDWVQISKVLEQGNKIAHPKGYVVRETKLATTTLLGDEEEEEEAFINPTPGQTRSTQSRAKSRAVTIKMTDDPGNSSVTTVDIKGPVIREITPVIDKYTSEVVTSSNPQSTGRSSNVTGEVISNRQPIDLVIDDNTTIKIDDTSGIIKPPPAKPDSNSNNDVILDKIIINKDDGDVNGKIINPGDSWGHHTDLVIDPDKLPINSELDVDEHGNVTTGTDENGNINSTTIDELINENNPIDTLAEKDPIPTSFITNFKVMSKYLDLDSVTDESTKNKLEEIKNSNCPLIISLYNEGYYTYAEIIYPGVTYNISRIPQLYQNAPDMWTSKYSEGTSVLEWCSCTRCKTVAEISMLWAKCVYDTLNVKTTTLGTEWSSHVHYKKTIPESEGGPMKCILVTAPDEVVDRGGSILLNGETKDKIDLEKDTFRDEQSAKSLSGLQIYTIGDIHIILVKDSYIDKICYANFVEGAKDFVKRLKKSYENNTIEEWWRWLYVLCDWIISYDEPCSYVIPLLGYTNTNCPSINCTEIEHYKVNKALLPLVRYCGAIKPSFVTPDMNRIYLKKLLKKDDVSSSVYAKYAGKGFAQNYPSIGYYPWIMLKQRVSDNGRDVLRVIPSTSDIDANAIELLHPYEYKWYNDGLVLLLKPTIDMIIEYDTDDALEDVIDDGTSALEYLIKLRLAEIYNVDYEQSSDYINYIYDRYNWKSNWNYADNTSIKKYVYSIKLTLK